MTAKDYIKIADVIKNLEKLTIMPKTYAVVDYVISDFADMLAKDNPKFDRKRFVEYIAGKVGPKGGKI